MISLEVFIKGIQQAILNANEALMEDNHRFLSQFFEKSTDKGELLDVVKNTFEKAEKVKKKAPGSLKQIKSFTRSLETLKNKILEEGASQAERGIGLETLSPKMVTLNYPVYNEANEIVNQAIEVPLITLVPITSSAIEEFKLTTDLQVSTINDRVHLDFGNVVDDPIGADPQHGATKKSIGHIELTLKPQKLPEGLKDIIEGYEKALKAQIPS